MIVIQLEVAFEDSDTKQISESMAAILDFARNHATARAVGSYSQLGSYSDPSNEDWRNKITSYITVPTTTVINIDP